MFRLSQHPGYISHLASESVDSNHSRSGFDSCEEKLQLLLNKNISFLLKFVGVKAAVTFWVFWGTHLDFKSKPSL